MSLLLVFAAPALRGESRVERGEVARLLDRRCVGCHGEKKASGKLRLDSRDAILAGGRQGAAIVAGASGESLLIARVTPGAEEPMPPEGKGEPLSASEIELLRRWIDGGAEAIALERDRELSEVALGELPAAFAPVFALAGDPTRERFAVARGAEVRLYELKSSEDEKGGPKLVELADFDAKPLGIIDALAFAPDGSALAVGGFRAVRVIALPAAGESDAEANPDPDGKSDAESTPAPKAIADFAAGSSAKVLAAASLDRVLALAYSPDGTRLAIGGGLPTETGEVRVYDLETGEAIWQVEPHSDTVFALAWSADGSILATASADRVTYLLDAKDGGVQRRLEGHTGHVLGVALSPDAKQAATVGADGELRLWNLAEDLVEERAGRHDAPATWVGYRDEKELVTVSADHRVRMWDARNANGRANLDDARRDLPPGASLHTAALAANSARLLVAREDGALFVFDLEKRRLLAKSE